MSLKKRDGGLRGTGPFGTRLRLELDPYPDFQGGKALRRGQRAAKGKNMASARVLNTAKAALRVHGLTSASIMASPCYCGQCRPMSIAAPRRACHRA